MIYRSYEAGCGYSTGLQPNHCRCIPRCCCSIPAMQPGCAPHPPFPPQPRGSFSVLNTASTGAATVAAGGAIPFELNNVTVGTDISHAAGTGIVSLNTPGVYLVTFTGTAGPAAAAELPDIVEAELRLNGTAIPGASSANTFAAATDVGTFAITTAVSVSTVPATLSVVVPEVGAIFSDASLTVQKLGTVPTTTPPLLQTPYYMY